MIEEEYLSYPEQVTAFLDGELDPAETEGLFYEMAHNPELQEMMRGQIKLNSAFQSGMLTAPAHLKDNVLLKTGLAVTGVATIAGGQSAISRILQSKAFMAIFASSLAVIATVLLTRNFYQPESSIINNYPAAKSSLVQKNIPVSDSREINANNILNNKLNASCLDNCADRSVNKPSNIFASGDRLALNKDSRIISRENNIIPQAPDAADLAQSFNQNPQSRTIAAIAPVMFSPLNNQFFIGTEFKPGEFQTRELAFNDFLKNISIEVRGLAAKSFVNADVKPLSKPLINDFGLGMFYDINPNNAIGLEIGQENFLQHFNGKDNGLPVDWKQNYTAFWTGLAYVYTMDGFSYIEPFGKLFVGGTRVGPLVKATLGAKMNLSDKFALFAGAENSGLFYAYQSKMFATYKLGITAGVSVRF